MAGSDTTSTGERLGHRILDRRLRFETMDRRLRRVSVGAIAAIALTAAAVATRALPQARLDVHFGQSGEASVPVIVTAGAVLVMVVAWSYLLAGVLHASVAVRLGGMTVYSLAMIGLAVLGGTSGAEVHITRSSSIRAAAGAGAAALVVLALWGVALTLWIRDRLELRAEPSRGHHHHIHGLTFLAALVATTAVFAFTGAAAGSVGGFVAAIEVHLSVFEIPLIPIVMLAGSDFAEWGEVIGAHAVDLLHHRRIRWAAPGLAMLAAAAVLVDGARLSWPAVRVVVWALSAAVELALIAAMVWLLGRWIPRPTVSLRGLVVASLISLLVVGFGVSQHLDWGVTTVVWLLPAIVALTLGLLRHRWAAGCLIVAASGVASAFWLTPLIPQGDMEGFRVFFAGWLLVVVAWRWLRRRGPVLAGIPAHLIAVLAVIQVLSWAFQWYSVGGALGERLSVIAAIILFAAITWDILMSGGPVTNVHGPHLPRHARVMLYTGYAMLCACTIALFSSWEGTFTTDLGIARDVWPRAGLFLLGLPAALTAFLLGVIPRPRDGAG